MHCINSMNGSGIFNPVHLICHLQRGKKAISPNNVSWVTEVRNQDGSYDPLKPLMVWWISQYNLVTGPNVVLLSPPSGPPLACSSQRALVRIRPRFVSSTLSPQTSWIAMHSVLPPISRIKVVCDAHEGLSVSLGMHPFLVSPGNHVLAGGFLYPLEERFGHCVAPGAPYPGRDGNPPGVKEWTPAPRQWWIHLTIACFLKVHFWTMVRDLLFTWLYTNQTDKQAHRVYNKTC